MLQLASQHPGGRALIIDTEWRTATDVDTTELVRAVAGTLEEVEAAAVGAVIAPDGTVRLVATHRAPVERREETEDGYRAWRAAGTLPLDGGPLVRASVVRIGNEHVVRLLVHHAVLDGYAATRIFRRIVERLAAAPRALSFERRGDLVALAAATAPALAPDPAFWAAATDGLGAPGRPVSFADRTAPPDDRPLRVRTSVAAAGVIGRRSWPVEAVATIAAYTARHLGTPDARIGVPATLRRTPLERATPTQWMTVLPTRLAVPDDATPAGLAAELRRWLDAAAARVRAGERPEQLATAVPAAWRTGRVFGPLVNVLPDLRLTGWSLDVTAWGPVSDCLFSVYPVEGDRLVVDGVFHSRLYGAREASAHVEAVAALLGAALAAPDAPFPPVPVRPVDPDRVAVPGGWIAPGGLLAALAAAGFPSETVELRLDAPVTVVLRGASAEQLPAARAVVPPGVRVRRAERDAAPMPSRRGANDGHRDGVVDRRGD